MTDDGIQKFKDHQGVRRRIVHADGALESWFSAIGRVRVDRAEVTEGFYIRFYETWANEIRITPGRVTPEGTLPDGNKFYAIRNGDIRAYFWYSKTLADTMVISHYVHKRWNTLRKSDIKRVRQNWRNFGDGGFV